jgi:cytochrome P450
MMPQETLLQHIVDYTNCANPYPLYAELRKTPVSRQADGTYVVSTYREIVALLHDPRVSSDLRNRTEPETSPAGEAGDAEDHPVQNQQLPSSFLILDPPEHDRLHRLATRQFGPPHRPDLVNSMRPALVKVVNDLIDQFQDQHQIDIVASFTYPFPVTVICELLGVPRQDEVRFHSWADAIVMASMPINKQTAKNSSEKKRNGKRRIG